MSTVSSCPTLLLYTSKSKMESFEESNVNKDRLLEPPSLTDSNSEEEDVKPTIKPRLSPLPRRRSSVSSDEGDLEPPTTVTRKVSFADAFGFDLVSVKEFDSWEIPTVSQNFEMESIKVEEFYLTPSFILPPVGGIMERLYAKKVALESVDFIPGTTSMKGLIRVLNLSYEKQIYVRMSLDDWQSYYDLLAEYVPDSCNGETDQFFFTISLASPYQKEGATLEFSICYETAVGTFWENNEGRNYVLTCEKKECLVEVEKPSEDVTEKNKKSCLKPVTSKEDEDLDVFEAESPTAAERYIPTIICSHDEDNNDEEKEHTSEEKNNDEESDLELFLSQKLMKASITSSEEKLSSGYSEQTTVPDERQLDDEMKYFSDNYSGIIDYRLQEPEECNNSGVYFPMAETTSSLVAEDLTPMASDDYHSEDHKVLSQECVYKTEERAVCLDDTNATNQISELVQIPPGVKSHLPQYESGQWSTIEEQIKDSKSNICLKTSETPSCPRVETIQLTNILDDNANLSFSQNIGNVPYFSTDDTEGIKDEQREIGKTESMENRFSDNNVSIYNSKESDALLLVSTDNTEQECPLSISELEDSQDLSHKCEPSNSAFDKEHTESNEAICSLASTSDAYLFKESQVKDTGEERSLFTSFCKDPKTVDHISEISDEKQYVAAEKETDLPDSPTMSALVSQQYYDMTQDSSSSHCDHKNDKKHAIDDNKDVVLSDNGEQYDFKYPLYREEEIIIYEADSTTPITYGLNDFTEKELSCQTVSLPECPSSIACTTAENVTHSTLHAWNEMLGCLPSDVTQGNKVIITKITEEKGQSDTRSQGKEDRKPSYMDIGDSGEVTGQKAIGEESEQKCILVSEARIELSSIKNEDIHMSPGKVRVDNNGEGEKINTCKLKHFSEDDIIHEGGEYVSKEQYKLSCKHRPSSLDAESEVDVEPITQSSNDFAELSDDIDIRLGDDFKISSTAKKEAVEFTDLLELTITEDSINIDNIHSTREEGNIGPSILISEPDDEGAAQCRETEEQNKPEETQQYYYRFDDHETHPDQQIQSEAKDAEPLNINHVSSKVLCFIMFIVFAGLMYHYDFLVCFALYLFSLYWLYWEGDRGEKPIRKE
ncbi:protein phosphatase 1 regulatory subunit 3A [Mixophyes fleayi]|uniref:protein phosphatase 1 regulatory subunit 3A n=1 Tax=Mixophyes fleayi TaxID=3061075 RepID=UPI003F4DA148